MNISAYDSSSISTLFSSVGSKKSTSASYTGLDNLAGTLSDFASIRKGSYTKLIRAYYEKVDTDSSDESSSVTDKNNSTDTDSAKTLAGIKKDADDLNSSAKEIGRAHV